MSHNEEHHDSAGSNLPFSMNRMVTPGLIFMFLMFTYSSWSRCCKDNCCSTTEQCAKECKKEKGDHKESHDENHEDHGKKHH